MDEIAQLTKAYNTIAKALNSIEAREALPNCGITLSILHDRLKDVHQAIEYLRTQISKEEKHD